VEGLTPEDEIGCHAGAAVVEPEHLSVTSSRMSRQSPETHRLLPHRPRHVPKWLTSLPIPSGSASAMVRLRHRRRGPTVVLPAVKDQILQDLDQLSAEQQKQAAELVHGLVSRLPKGASIEDLMQLAGSLDDQSAREMMEAIEEGCERVDLDEW
jgi:hypothetical protein